MRIPASGICLLICAFLHVAAFSLQAAQPAGTWQLGVRLGVVTNSEDDLQVPTPDLEAFINKTNPYIEGCVDWYALDWLALHAALGSYSKGELRFDVYVNGVYDGTFIGEATIYPMQLGLKLSPFTTELPMQSQPYLQGGGALVVGRETATLGPYDSFFARYSDGNIASETNFGWWTAIGVDLPLSSRLQLDLNIKYFDISFSGDIVGMRDYSGVHVTFGIGYLSIVE